MTRIPALLATLALAGCEGFDRQGIWHDGIPTRSGYYVDPVRDCIHIGQINNSMSGYHAGVLERMCDGKENVGWLMLARWIVEEGAPTPSRHLFPQTVDAAAPMRSPRSVP